MDNSLISALEAFHMFEGDNFIDLIQDVGLDIKHNLKGQNLSQIEFIKESIPEIDLSYTNLYSANFEESNLKGSNFKCANLKNAILRNCDLSGCNFTDANIQGAIFEGALIDNLIAPPQLIQSLYIEGARTSKPLSATSEEPIPISDNPIKIHICDDHDLIRYGIKTLIEKTSGDCKIISESDSGENAITEITRNKPDIVLMDINMPGMGGFEATNKLLKIYKNLKIIIFTVHSEGVFPLRLIQAGAQGYLVKGTSIDDLIQAIKKVHAGFSYICQEVSENITTAMNKENSTSIFDILSQREAQVYHCIINGMDVDTISKNLLLSKQTISTYRYRILEKIGLTDDNEIRKFSEAQGLV